MAKLRWAEHVFSTVMPAVRSFELDSFKSALHDVRQAISILQTMQPQAEPAAGEQAGAVARSYWACRTDYTDKDNGWDGWEPCATGYRERCKNSPGFEWMEMHPLAAPGAAIAAREQEVDEATAMKGGRWVSADDIEHMTGELLSLATGDPYTPTKMVDAFHTLRAALASRDEAPATPQREIAITDAMVDAYLKAQRETVERVDREWGGKTGKAAEHLHPVREACRNGLRAALTQPTTVQQAETLKYVESMLTNLQPHIPQACYPGRAAFIDNYIEPVLERVRAAITQPVQPAKYGTISERAEPFFDAMGMQPGERKEGV